MVYRRPPFTGIHETLPPAGEGAPNEGGGDIPPYGEDIINRIVDINFPEEGGPGGIGAVFVSGDDSCYLRTAAVPEPTLEQEWVGLGDFMFGIAGHCSGSSYARIAGRPTFLVCGNGNNFLEFGHFGGIIALSHNGTDWTTAYFSEVNWSISDLVWDPSTEAFYANGVTGGAMRSFNGYDWVHLPDEDFWSHTPPDEWPDGLRGIDPDTGTIIYPEDVPADVIHAECTAFCGGMWMAGGWVGHSRNSATACSLDGGATWQLVTEGTLGMTDNFAITCISGGPIEDFQ